MPGSQSGNYEIIDQEGYEPPFDDLDRTPSVFDVMVDTIVDLSIRDLPERKPVVDNVPRAPLRVPVQIPFDSHNAPLTGDSFIPNWGAIPDDEDFRL